ncbi:MAG: PIN domain-containing protein [Candidatus Sumerlaeota bacterium]|nr:PIN domain-containing protein [Candidatus Sumerlaeota bacterium]
MIVFIDTNVLLDVLLRRAPFCEASAKVWSLADEGKIKAGISALSFSNIFYLVRKLDGKLQANKALHVLRAAFNVIPVDLAVIDQALASKADDFEDAVQHVSAKRQRAEFLVTRNKPDFPQDGPKLVTPEEFLLLPD